MPVTLPVPDTAGVYTFPNDLVAAHRAHQQQLAARRAAGDPDVIQLLAPHESRPYLIERRRPAGRPVVAIEPHHDDLALSASGTLLTSPRPLTVVTVFTRSTTAHPTAAAAHPGEAGVSALRAEEGRQALRPLQAGRLLLGYRDARPPYGPYDRHVLDQVTTNLARVLDEIGAGAELLAPAGVTRHPDHLLVHEAARRLGCTWFWEDVAFWATYALSADDRHLFTQRVGGALAGQVADITASVLDKLTLLYVHASQLQPLHAMYRPIRYAYTVAAGARPALYGERFYRQVTA
ncbi:PIG-L deacetylase family protein [Planotetraspora sp. GP83]|uniref:PIG-L deacetylase family protein n=1 Tax=Planotetraspora sp. GP83 TaxID=3156264 RepID=UPI00351976DE